MKQLTSALVALTLAFTAQAHAADAPAVPVSDSDITTNVQAALAAEPTLKDQKINVSTKAGEVRLTGVVSDQQLMVTAGHTAEHVAGVKFVLNEIDNDDYLRAKAGK